MMQADEDADKEDMDNKCVINHVITNIFKFWICGK